MPVHFTCPHCTQLLSVARRKVGNVVQCANCGGGVLVPPPAENVPTSHPNSAEHDEEFLTPDQLLEPPAPEPQELDRASDSATGDYSNQAYATGVWTGMIPVTRLALYSVGVLLVAVALCSFLLGWAMGRGTSASQVNVSSIASHRIYGRVKYLTTTGRSAPDTKSVVVALPTRKKPDEKLDVHSLRPERAVLPNSQDAAIQGIRSIGGDFAVTNRSGDYDLQVSESGEYFLLVLSSHLARPEDRPPITTDIVELGQYFKQPTVLLGKNDFIWTRQVVRDSAQFDTRFGDQND